MMAHSTKDSTLNLQVIAVVLVLVGCVFSVSLCSVTWATTIYSYVDDQGSLTYTDTLDTIPEKYRAKVKTHEQRDATSSQAPSSRMEAMKQSLQQTVSEQVKSLAPMIPIFNIEGLTPNQSKILSYAGSICVILLLMMYLSKSPFVRMLGFCLLVVVGIGVPILMYVDNDGPIGTIKTRANASGQAQLDRAQQLSQ